MNRPSWDQYYMDMTFYIAQKSLDPHTKHGCMVVDSEHTPLSMGFNSPPRGCIDEEIPLTRPEKYPFMIHAEENAIINAARSSVSLKGSTFYITGHPCPKCFRMILNVGAIKIIYGSVNSKCIAEEDLKAIGIMNQKWAIPYVKKVPQIEFVKWDQSVGWILKQAQDYIQEKVV